MQGTLTAGALPGLLRTLYVGRRTGLLHLSRGDSQRTVRFRHGHIVGASSSVDRERLGDVLVREGWINADQLEAATTTVRAGGRRLGDVLVEKGALAADRLDDALGLHAREILRVAFAASDGAFSFEETPDPPPESDVTLKLSTGELILEAVRQLDDAQAVRAALGNTDRVLALSGDPLLRFQQVNLTPSDGYVLSRVDGVLSAREVIEISGLPTEEVERSLYGLLCTGIVEYLPGATRNRKSGAAARPQPSARPADGGQDAPGAPPAAPPAAAAASGPKPAAAAAPPREDPAVARRKQTEERRREIEEAYDGRKRNHFEVLGLTRAATEQQVKEAYFALAKRFHPDAHHDPELDDLRDKLEAVFIRLGDAYEKLRNPRSRGMYESDLAAREPRRFNPPTAQAPSGPPAAGAPAAEAPEAPAPAPAPAPIDGSGERRAAEALFRAEKMIEAEKFFDAIQLLEPVVEALPLKRKVRARLLLATAYGRNPNWQRQAENELKKATAEDRKSVDAHFRLAQFYQAQGLKSRAVALLRRVLELQPEHVEAATILGQLTPGDEAHDASGGGFLRRLFRKD